MATKLNVLTGATGLLGSHIAEQLRERGDRVRAIVRPGGNAAFLREIGAEVVEGTLQDAAALRGAIEGADTVYHCAAKVGEWGKWREYQEGTINSTVNVLAACKEVGVGRVMHISSIGVYGHLYPSPSTPNYTEDEPHSQNMWRWGDYYQKAKIIAEARCREYPGPLTIIRPSWIYGPRDRNTVPRVFAAFDAGRVWVIGSGENLLNIIYAGDVARGAILAADAPIAVGRAYNLTSEGEITQRQFIDQMCDILGRPPIRRRMPFKPAFYGGFLAELIGWAIRLKRPPHITRYTVCLIGRSTQFSTARARAELGWKPEVGIREGLERTLDWYFASSGRPRLPRRESALTTP